MTEFLSRNLHGYRSNERQGSYAQGTIIRPVDDGEYDADILVFIAETRGKQPRDYVADLHSCLSRNPPHRRQVAPKDQVRHRELRR